VTVDHSHPASRRAGDLEELRHRRPVLERDERHGQVRREVLGEAASSAMPAHVSKKTSGFVDRASLRTGVRSFTGIVSLSCRRSPSRPPRRPLDFPVAMRLAVRVVGLRDEDRLRARRPVPESMRLFTNGTRPRPYQISDGSAWRIIEHRRNRSGAGLAFRRAGADLRRGDSCRRYVGIVAFLGRSYDPCRGHSRAERGAL
jgi:hypothetical protein